jgi:hypothetical protein
MIAKDEARMTERDDLLDAIDRLNGRRSRLMADESRLHEAYMAAPDVEAAALGNRLEDICGEIDEIGGKIEPLKARLWEIEGAVSRYADQVAQVMDEMLMTFTREEEE